MGPLGCGTNGLWEHRADPAEATTTSSSSSSISSSSNSNSTNTSQLGL